MINLFVSYYQDSDLARQAEIDFCLRQNLANPLLNVVVLESQARFKYQDFFDLIKKYSHPDDLNIIANSDIFFDSTLSLIDKLSKNKMLALSRWDYYEDGTSKHFARRDSQDSWIFRGSAENVYGDFNLGYRGCDNRIAYEFKKAGWEVSNPSIDVKSFHVHNTGVRNYSAHGPQHLVPGPYEFIPTSKL